MDDLFNFKSEERDSNSGFDDVYEDINIGLEASSPMSKQQQQQQTSNNNGFLFNNIDDEDEENFFVSPKQQTSNLNSFSTTTNNSHHNSTSHYSFNNKISDEINLHFNFDDYDNSTTAINSSILNNNNNSNSNNSSSFFNKIIFNESTELFKSNSLIDDNNSNSSNNNINSNNNSNNNINNNINNELNSNIISTMPGDNSFIYDNSNNNTSITTNSYIEKLNTNNDNEITSPIEKGHVRNASEQFSSPIQQSQKKEEQEENKKEDGKSSIFNLNSIKKAILNTSNSNLLNFSTDAFWKDLGDNPLIDQDTASDQEKWLRLGEDIPQCSWARRLDHNFPDHKHFQVSMWQGLKLVGIGYRMWKYVKKENSSGRVPMMDPFNLPKPGPIMGVPIGGIGSGSINRGWRGDFVRWNMNSGLVTNETVDVDKFSVYINFDDSNSASSSTGSTPSGTFTPNGPNFDPSSTKSKQKATVLYPGKPKNNLNLDVWNWGLKGENSCYFGLFPRAWTVYEEPHPDIKLVCKQISPVIPHNYQESSYPVGVYVWKIENNNKNSSADVSLMLTWQNSIGTKSDQDGGHYNKYFTLGDEPNKKIKGVTLIHRKEQRCAYNSSNIVYHDPMEYSIAVKDDPDVNITFNERFETTSRLDAANLWYTFNKKGELENIQDSRPSAPKKPIGAAVAAKVKVPAGGSKTIVFCIAWDQPITRFQLGSAYYKRYTKFYGNKGGNSQRIAYDALQNYKSWDNQIAQWQNPIIQDAELPSFYKMALFNELYYLVDGGTVWTHGSPQDQLPARYPLKTQLKPEDISDPNHIGRFAYLESLEYLMYNTYDVHFYSSYALAMLWPLLEISLQYDIAEATMLDYGITWEGIHSGQQIPRKKRCTVPHDLGNPGEDPWKRVNSYNIQDISRWKDLPSKFVLQVYRDYLVVEDKNFLLQVYNVVEEVIQRTLESFDTDHDGVVDNEGFPDQTYDVWPAVGCSAYSGGLWLASLKVASEMAKILGFKEDESIYNAIFEKGSASYTKKLWNGYYFKYDCSNSVHADSIMSDMLAGHWYLLSCGLPSYMTFDQALSSLSIINEYNVNSYGKERCGAVNGMRPEGVVDNTCLQSSEVWIGTSFSLAATMIQHHMDKDAWELVKGIVNSSYNRWGFQYQTPEAWDSNGCYRAGAYMRPLSIWSIQWALLKKKYFDFYDESLKSNNNSNNNINNGGSLLG
ncbi:hypothetical protein DICPUDRAFT_158887 [Dictyostelium purpureum]|uniref:Glucosylceramidase n=1 Tax=Dictyostelium purpureum TaxID=5786 RepID=F1A2R6_DICPU|nr:uncharacterized protein DICPUDRAFT_158887 [Dictyostelium purpureum]EGC29519.1 hypothetical protein DICPUDRAFT_158887 [Dictyostelium purpureum]|eukprot:XP_003293963.1 hypothetical protein DICPUDRAFT_158887 [Dictyostelium purpureum]